MLVWLHTSHILCVCGHVFEEAMNNQDVFSVMAGLFLNCFGQFTYQTCIIYLIYRDSSLVHDHAYRENLLEGWFRYEIDLFFYWIGSYMFFILYSFIFKISSRWKDY